MKDICKRLAIAIRAKGSFKERELDGELLRFYEYSELSLSLSKFRDNWKIDGLSFEVFGNEFFLTVDGSVSMVIGEDDNEVVFTVKDQKLIESIEVFLEWRIAALNELEL